MEVNSGLHLPCVWPPSLPSGQAPLSKAKLPSWGFDTEQDWIPLALGIMTLGSLMEIWYFRTIDFHCQTMLNTVQKG